MAAITAIINPTGQLPMVFFLNEASHCDLHLDKGAFGATDMIPIGPVKKLSAFASIMHENLVCDLDPSLEIFTNTGSYRLDQCIWHRAPPGEGG